MARHSPRPGPHNLAATPSDTAKGGKVFVSYSRADAAFAADLVLGLAACGFEAYIDREDIAAGEAWEARLASLISDADSVVYVLSPDSLSSEHCSWEIRHALATAKRLLPVVCRPVADGQAPPEVSRLNYIFFTGDGRSFASGLSELAAALRTDLGWLREHTRIGALAARWLARDRSDALLLRGDELDVARAWLTARPAGAVEITDAQLEFVNAGVAAREAADLAARRRRNGTLAAVSVVAVAMAGLAAASIYLWRKSDAVAVDLASANTTLEARSVELADANTRLSANIGLRASSGGLPYLEVPGGWFPVAANFSGAVARIERRDADGKVLQVSSGLVIDGGLVNAARAGEPMLLTPLISSMQMSVPDPAPSSGETPFDGVLEEGERVDFEGGAIPNIAQMRVSSEGPLPRDHKVFACLPVVDAALWIQAADLVWRTPEHLGGVTPFQLFSLKGKTPVGVRPVTAADIDCTSPGGALTDAVWMASLGVDAGGSAYAGDRTATLYISRLLDRSDPYDITYDHSTQLGAAGGPVFDLSSGKLTAIHIGSRRSGDTMQQRVGYGLSLPMILDIAREGSEPREGRLPPVCETGQP